MSGEVVEEENGDLNSSLIHSIHDSDLIRRTGTKWTAVAYILTGVIGAGVLSLSWSVAQLGWILGPFCIILIAAMTLISAFLVSDCYRHPDPERGPIRNKAFMEAANLLLGKKQQLIIRVLVQLGLFGGGVAATITAAASVRAILQSNCHHREGPDAKCKYGDNLFILIFGLIQILLAQTPDFHSMRWLSILATVMALSYALIGTGLGLAKVIENGTVKGSIAGVPGSNLPAKVFATFTALGDIAFSYPFTLIQLEIEDTLKSPPPENKTMKAASAMAVSIITFFYLLCGSLGYAAFGDATPGNLLTDHGFSEPYWLVDLANACIIMYLVGGYQIFTQAAFSTAERWFVDRFPNSRFIEKSYSFKLPLLPPLRTNLFKLCFRTAFVVLGTTIAAIFPYFNSFLGVLGAFNFWPLVVYFPMEMYSAQKKVRAWTREWILLRAFSLVGFVITVVGTVGSIEQIIGARFS